MKQAKWWLTLAALAVVVGGVRAEEPPKGGSVDREESCPKQSSSMELSVPILSAQQCFDWPVSLTFQNVPFKEALLYFGIRGIYIPVDKVALAEANFDMNVPVSISVKDVSLKTFLNLLLKQVKLTYVIQNEVLTITTPEFAKGPLKIVTYPVADLVVPVDGQVLSVFSQDRKESDRNATVEDLLMELIQQTIEPNSWYEAGGKGIVQYFPIGMALVINQTQDVQEQVDDLLAALRKLLKSGTQQYVIQVWILEAHRHGEARVITSPRMTTTLGKSAKVLIGQTIPIWQGAEDKISGYGFSSPAGYVERAEVGQNLDVCIFGLTSTRLRLDLTYENSTSQRNDAGDLDIAGTRHRFLRRVELGKTLKLPLKCGTAESRRSWLEVTVNEVSRQEKAISLNNLPALPR